MGLPRARVNRPVRAADFNALVDAIEQAMETASAAVGRSGALPVLLRCVVKEVTTAGGAVLGGAEVIARWPDETFYTLAPIGRTEDAWVRLAVPDFGRPVPTTGRLARIVPATPGDKAFVLRFPDGAGGWTTWCGINERLAVRPCPGG